MTRTSWNNKKNCLLCSVLVNMDQQKKVINNKYLKILYSPIWICLKFSVNFFIHFIPFRSDKTKKICFEPLRSRPGPAIKIFFFGFPYAFHNKKESRREATPSPPPLRGGGCPPPFKWGGQGIKKRTIFKF